MGIFSQKTAPCCICGADANGLHRVKDGVLCERCYRRAESYLRIRTKKALSLGNDFKEVTGTDAARTRTNDACLANRAVLQRMHAAGHEVGISFHVGTQQRDPGAWDGPLDRKSVV